MVVDAYTLNDELAQRICRDLKWNGHTFAYGQYVCLVAGQVVGVCADLESSSRFLEQRPESPDQTMIVPVHPPEPDIVRGPVN